MASFLLIVAFLLSSLAVLSFLILLPLAKWRRPHQPLRSRGRMIFLNFTSLMMGSTVIALLIRLLEEMSSPSEWRLWAASLLVILHVWKGLVFFPCLIEAMRISSILWMRSHVLKIIPHITPPPLVPPTPSQPSPRSTTAPANQHKQQQLKQQQQQQQHAIVLHRISLIKHFTSIQVILPLSLILIVLDSIFTFSAFMLLRQILNTHSEWTLLIVFCSFSAISRHLILLMGLTIVIVILFFQRENLRLRFELICLVCFSFPQSILVLIFRMVSILFPSAMASGVASDLILILEVCSGFVFEAIVMILPILMTFHIHGAKQNREELADQLIQTLRQPRMFVLFKDWAEREWSQENLLFIEAVESFRNSSGNDAVSQAEMIFQHFISEEGLLSLSISRDLREQIRGQIFISSSSQLHNQKRGSIRRTSPSGNDKRRSIESHHQNHPSLPSDLFDPVVEEVMEKLVESFGRFCAVYHTRFNLYLEEQRLSKTIGRVSSSKIRSPM